jgi:hypothetical protein
MKAKSEEQTQPKSYPTLPTWAMQKAECFGESGSQSQSKGGGEDETKNRDHRREAPACSAKPAESLSQRLVWNLWRASANGDA